MTVSENSLKTSVTDNYRYKNWDEMSRRGSDTVQSEPLLQCCNPQVQWERGSPPEERGVRAPCWALQPWGPALRRGDPHNIRLQNQQGLHLRALWETNCFLEGPVYKLIDVEFQCKGAAWQLSELYKDIPGQILGHVLEWWGSGGTMSGAEYAGGHHCFLWNRIAQR